jgi:hypothetical protein
LPNNKAAATITSNCIERLNFGNLYNFIF